ncbi:hypothetical protein BABINDRAFT_42266 [Babjeviella inositovora NRRL Y-12698]|uniref:D-xylose 1-dehydrogenase (NADP(+), D-xylono-1,5-lactone-forming) n=1 Tax=Babjeviella inositovora NRRL Y-12698 TaxID=984486 RepID=A0A1E3QH90_9ASCO|nr:uncharacterized protein BABINDRAFT_42266 [Babjeviella inositovora NRRL Y-12698]ODQ77065.1 hypothetical protein BABINDRAFT_42266 [Babjeviella inositovora NRRL Y-12698]
MTPTIRWGIIGAGKISAKFTEDICRKRPQTAPVNHRIAAIGCSSSEKGRVFVSEHVSGPSTDTTVASLTYSEVYASSDVDAVYIGLPHVFHKQHSLEAIAQGKHVLCEKPCFMNLNELEEVLRAAQTKGVYFMEAVWVRFFPVMQEVTTHLHDLRTIGDLKRCVVNYSPNIEVDALPLTDRLIDRKLGGGAIMDIGVYTIHHYRMLMDPRSRIQSMKDLDIESSQSLVNGVDYMTSILVSPKDRTSQGILTCSFYSFGTGPFAMVEGTLGKLEILTEQGMPAPLGYTITFRDGRDPISKSWPVSQDGGRGAFGFFYEADAFALDIAAGKLQNDTVSWNESRIVLGIVDAVRRASGMTYEQDF